MPIVCVPAKLPVSTRRLIKHKHHDGAGTIGLQARMTSPPRIGLLLHAWLKKLHAMAVVTRFAEAEVKDLHDYFGRGLTARPVDRVVLCAESPGASQLPPYADGDQVPQKRPVSCAPELQCLILRYQRCNGKPDSKAPRRALG